MEDEEPPLGAEVIEGEEEGARTEMEGVCSSEWRLEGGRKKAKREVSFHFVLQTTPDRDRNSQGTTRSMHADSLSVELARFGYKADEEKKRR